MDVKQQEYFVAIVEEGSLSKAARKLYISQPTLSQFLSKLEETWGVRLIERGNSTLTVTEAGRLFYEYSKKILDVRDEFEGRMADLNRSSKTSLRIGNNLMNAMVMLNDIVSELTVKYPQLKVTFRHENPYQLQEMTCTGELDMGFSCYNHPYPQLEYLDFPAYEMVIVLPEDHPLAGLGSADLREGLPHLPLKRFENERFVLIAEGTVTGDITREYCEQNGVTLNVSTEVYNASFAIASMSCGLGISLFPPDVFEKMDDGFRFIGLDPPLRYKRALYYKRTAYKNMIFRDCIRIVKRLAETNSLFRRL